MPFFVGLDAAKRTTKVCIINEVGETVRTGVVDSDPKAIVGFLRGEGRRYKRVGLEAWNLAPWLYAGLARAGLPVICIETRHANAVLKATRANKTDHNDARGIAEIMRTGIYKAVHVKSPESQRSQSFLTARKLLRNKAIDIENGIMGLLLGFGLKLKAGALKSFERRAQKLASSNADASRLVEPLLTVRRCIHGEVAKLDAALSKLAQSDPVCRRLMTAPGVGALTALTFRAAVDEPGRFPRSRDIAAHFGLTPRSIQSGERDLKGRISRRGDATVRTALFVAARSQLRRAVRSSWLKIWGGQIAARRGKLKALIAIARRLAVTLHRMWITETDFRWTAAAA
jgi:transposase